MAKADIELLFGVAGGGSVSGASGAQIKGDLDAIVNAINANPYDIKIQLDQQSKTNFKSQLADLTKYAQDQAKAIKDAYNGIIFPTPPGPPPPDSGNGGRKKKDHLIAYGSSEYLDALSKLQKYQLQIQKMQKSWTVAAEKGSKSEYAMKRINDELSNMKGYRDALDKGAMSANQFAEHMKNVGITIKQADAEVKLFGEDIDNHLIPDRSVDWFEGLTDIQKYRKQIKQMQEEWTATKAPGAKGASAMSTLAAEATQLEALEKSLRDGKAGAEDLAKGLEHAGAVIKQVTAEVKYFGEDRSLIDFKPGAEANVKALVELSKAISTTKKNYESWTAAAKGSTEGDYRGLKSALDSFEQLNEEVKSGTITFEEYQKRFAGIKKGADQCSSSIRAAGKDTKSLGDRVKELTTKFSKWLSISQLVMKGIQTFKQMASIVVEVDTAMTELRKVTDETEVTYDKFLTKAVTRAKELGATLTDVVSASASFARLGYNIAEASQLADAAIVYKNVADGIDNIEDASASIISTMQAFGIKTSEVMSIVDKFNEVDVLAS